MTKEDNDRRIALLNKKYLGDDHLTRDEELELERLQLICAAELDESLRPGNDQLKELLRKWI